MFKISQVFLNYLVQLLTFGEKLRQKWGCLFLFVLTLLIFKVLNFRGLLNFCRLFLVDLLSLRFWCLILVSCCLLLVLAYKFACLLCVVLLQGIITNFLARIFLGGNLFLLGYFWLLLEHISMFLVSYLNLLVVLKSLINKRPSQRLSILIWI